MHFPFQSSSPTLAIIYSPEQFCITIISLKGTVLGKHTLTQAFCSLKEKKKNLDKTKLKYSFAKDSNLFIF